jgi:hypothetical protein
MGNNPEPINVIGNSHAWLFTGLGGVSGKKVHGYAPIGELPHFRVFPIGPCTAWGFGLKHTPEVYKIIEANNLEPGSVLMFVVGEIDCRWHILNNFKGKNIWEDVCDVVARYVAALMEFKTDYNVIAWGAHPPGGKGHDPSYPRFGTIAQRMCVTEMFNARLADACDAVGINYASAFWDLRDKDHDEYYLDEIHLNKNALPFVYKAVFPILKSMGWECDS